MNKQDYEALAAKVWELSKEYYENNSSNVPDEEFDNMMRSLEAYEEQHPEDKLEDSPTTWVGMSQDSAFAQVKHPCQMLSLKNAFNEQELAAFLDKAGADVYVLQHKLDGLTIVVHYNDGKLVTAATRGDGMIGEDVTATAKCVSGIPSTIYHTGELWFRGEVIIRKKAFEEVNKERAAAGKPLFSNPRNAASGGLRQLDLEDARQRRMSAVFYDVYTPGIFMSHTEKLELIRELGMESVYCDVMEGKDLAKDVRYWEEHQGALDEPIDGLVIKVNDPKRQRQLGAGTKFPHWAIAYKFREERQVTRLCDVAWQLGRTGRITPVAILDPVEVDGSVVAHATLHNMVNIAALDLMIGDSVVVYKAAEIIPQIECVATRGEHTEPICEPLACPVCHTKLERHGAYLECPNTTCRGKMKARLEHFVSRECLDIKGFGPVLADELVDNMLVRQLGDVFAKGPATYERCPCMSPVLVKTLMESIARAKKAATADRVLASLGIPGLGLVQSRRCLEAAGSIQKLQIYTVEQLERISSIGHERALQINKGLKDCAEEIAQLDELGLAMEYAREEAQGALTGKTFCITGTLSSPRADIETLIKANGGIIVSAVTSKCQYLVAGDKAGSKLTKAQQKGIPVLSEDQLKEMING